MGFYGNITNTSKTQFSFDKRYPNRVSMDEAASWDGVYIGRYVLVEYEEPASTASFLNVYRTKEKRFYTSTNAETATEVKVDNKSVKVGTIVCVPAKKGNQNSFNIDEPDMGVSEFWQCTGSRSDGTAIFVLLTQSNNSNYHNNYLIDTATYGKGRGYDSTVWQKTYVNSVEKYVMIAELNTIVPTFDIAADAPTQTPLTPHFDTDSNNVYYKLHWQPSWGLRVKTSDKDLVTATINSSGEVTKDYTHVSTEQREYPSDETVTWTKATYDKNTGVAKTQYFNYPKKVDGAVISHIGTWKDSSENIEPVPAAIYYNKAGFDPSTIAYSDDKQYAGWDENNNHVQDEVSISSTGQSGALYPNHDGSAETSIQPDTQELSVMLPSIGDSVAKIWDIVYGDRETNADYNDQLGSENARNMTIDWESANAVQHKEGHRLVKREENGRYTYSRNQVNTVAGAINSMHDIMGMIIAGGQDSDGKETIVWETDENKLQSQIDGLNDEYIYYKDGKYYRKHKTYDFTEITDATASYSKVTLSDWEKRTNKLYFIDSDFTSTPGYILDNKFHPDVTYVRGLNPHKITLGGEYKPNTYYQLDISRNTGFNNDYYKLRLCSDTEYSDNKQYYIVKDIKMLTYKPVYFYTANKYYYKNAAGEYVLDTSETKTNKRVYYLDIQGQTVIENFKTYIPKKFYVQSGDSYVVSSAETFTPSVQYYGKYVPYYPNKYYYTIYTKMESPISKEAFIKGDYYIATEYAGSNIVVDGISTKNLPISQYDPSGTYYKRDFIKDSNINHSTTRHYYTVATTPGTNADSLGYYTEVKTWQQISLNKTTYRPGVYYIYEGGSYVLDVDDYNEGATYYQLIITYEQATEDNIINVDSAEEVFIMEFPAYSQAGDLSTRYFYQEIDKNYTNSTKYMWVELNASNISSLSSNTIYYQLETEVLKSVYAKNRYYYKYEVAGAEEGEGRNGSYLIASGAFDKNKEYFDNITYTAKVSTKYYYPNKYYYKDINGNYVLAISEKYGLDNYGNELTDKTYYTNQDLYVIDDTLNIYQKGAKWNCDSKTIPVSVTLGVRKERWELQELKDFAYRLNTVHGLMLKLHEILELNDNYTRDQSTIMGSLNLLNDKIANLGKMIPGSALVVDGYGRVNSASINTKQAFKTTNWQTSIGTGNNKTEENNRFIDITIDKDPTNPSFIAKHNITTVADTTTVSNKNTPFTNTNKGESNSLGNNNTTGDTLKLLTPIVDNMGHVVGKDTETVTLPYGYAFAEVGNRTNVKTNLDIEVNADRRVSANHVNSCLYLTMGNKWLRAYKDPEYTHQLLIGHYVGNINASTIEKDFNNEQAPITLDIKNHSFDEAGHIVAEENIKYTLPYSFKTFSVNNSSETSLGELLDNENREIVASNNKDIVNLQSTNKWLQFATDNSKTIYLGHTLSDLAAGEHSIDNIATPSFGQTIKLPKYTTDEAGHMTAIDFEEITLPASSILDITKEEDNTSSLVIDILLPDPSSGEFVVDRKNIGDLTLKGFELSSEETVAPISEEDTLNIALAKLKKEIDDNKISSGESLNTVLDSLEYTQEEVPIGSYITKVSQTKGKVAVETCPLLATVEKEENQISFISQLTIDETGSIAPTYEPIPSDYLTLQSSIEIVTTGEEVTTITVQGLINKLYDLEKANAELTEKVDSLTSQISELSSS